MDLPRLQMEMGHSGTGLLRTRYINMRGITSGMVEQFWSITPELIARTKTNKLHATKTKH